MIRVRAFDKEIDNGAGKPVALIRRIWTAPGILNSEREGGPGVEEDGDGEGEVGLLLFWGLLALCVGHTS